jgi:thiamine kinase-like enzyme
MSGMNDEAVREICALLNLGVPLGHPTPVAGGLLHRMWRLETTIGIYAVKDLNPEIVSRPGVPDVYRASERIARSAAHAGIPALPALQLMADPLLVLPNRSVLVFPWIEGHVLHEADVMAGDGRRIGALLGRLHELDFDASDLLRPDGSTPDLASFEDLLERGERARLEWAEDGERKLLEIASWVRCHDDGFAALPPDLVVSHRDIDPKNVLWDEHGEPCVIDWEGAGWVSPSVELCEVALNWSGQRIGPPKRDVFEAVLAGYHTARPASGVPLRDALACCLGGWLAWLHYNAMRSLGDTGAGDDERALGTREATSTLETLRSLAEGIPTWSSWTSAPGTDRTRA